MILDDQDDTFYSSDNRSFRKFTEVKRDVGKMISYVVASKNEVLHKSSHSYVRSTVFAQFCDFDEFVMSYRPQVEGGGVFLETEKLLPISQIVSIEFSFADSDIIFLKGEGEILSHSAQTEAVGPGIVIRFLNLDDKSKVLLSKLSNQYL